MKYLLLIVSFVSALLLLGYDYRQYDRAYQAVHVHRELAKTLNTRGRQRFEVQSLLTQLLLPGSSARDSYQSFENSAYFEPLESMDDYKSLLGEWNKWADHEKKTERVALSKAAFYKIPRSDEGAITDLSLITNWAEQSILLLDDIQEMDAELSDYVLAQSIDQLLRAGFVNVGIISLLLLAWFRLTAYQQKRLLNDSQHLNHLLEDERGKLIRSQKTLTSIMEDATQEKNNALGLARENQRLAMVVHQSADAIAELNPDGNIISLNDSGRRLFGVEASQFSTTSYIDFFDECNAAKIRKAIDSTLESRISQSLEAATKGKSTRIFDLQFTALEDSSDPTINRVSVVAHDVSLHHRESEQLHLMVEQAPNALIMTNSEGKIVLSNQEADHLFGYESQELTGLPIETLVPLSIQSSHPQLRSDFFSDPKARVMGAGRDLTGRHKNGNEVPVEIGLNPVMTQQGPLVIASIVDITERLRAADSLNVLNQQLQEKNQEMEQFIYSVSHDLKAPLVTIGGFSKKLLQDIGGQITERQQHKLARISANVTHMEALLNDLLQLSRVIRQDVEKAEVDLTDLVHELERTLEAAIQKTEAKIEIELPLLSVFANKRLLYQSLQNLVNNSLNYADESRPLVISISTREDSESVSIHVKDSGQGIDPKYHEKIFKIFERLDVGEGTGIGLAIVKTVMDKHNGSVQLDSTPGEGSIFSLHFPKPLDQEEKSHYVKS